jgi:hypothetical protein
MTLASHKRSAEEGGSAAKASHHQMAERAAQLIAELMDSAIRVPGTNFTIGLDPILGLLPGIGDTVAGMIGASILVLANQLGAPRIVQARMALNVFMNGTIGAIPGIGDLFSFWFKSNVRNARLLRLHATRAHRVSTAGDWVFVVSLIVGLLTILILAAAAGVWLIRELWLMMR